MKIAAQVLFHARSSPQRPALAFSAGVVTYGMLGRGLSTACARLRRKNLPIGGLVAIEVDNPAHHVALILALELCGLTSVSAMMRADLAAAGLVPNALLIDHFKAEDPTLRTIGVDDDWFALAPTVDVRDDSAQLHGRHYRIILSSGTTGRPKAIGYTPALMGRFMLHQSLMRSEGAWRNLSMMGPSTLGFATPIFALVQGGFACFAITPEDVLRMVRTYGIARLGFVTPLQLAGLVVAARQSADVLPSLRVIHVAGSRLPPDLAAEARARLCGNIIVSYGSTETGVLSYGRVGAPDEPPGSAGHLVPWVEVEARDASGRGLPPGTAGHLYVRSPDLANYVGAGQVAGPGGWFRTDDVGFCRDDGLLVIEGRASEVINRGGNVVAPDFIEAALERHFCIKEAAVFARTSATGFDEIWAAVVPSGLIVKADVLQFCRTVLGDRTPDGLEIVDALPRTEHGKLKRAALRERFAGDEPGVAR